MHYNLTLIRVASNLFILNRDTPQGQLILLDKEEKLQPATLLIVNSSASILINLESFIL